MGKSETERAGVVAQRDRADIASLKIGLGTNRNPQYLSRTYPCGHFVTNIGRTEPLLPFLPLASALGGYKLTDFSCLLEVYSIF